LIRRFKTSINAKFERNFFCMGESKKLLPFAVIFIQKNYSWTSKRRFQ
jgi:hypothetical protein